jgi:primosomal protein N' (replication factor Y)
VEGKLAPCGPGIERLAEEAAKLFPNARRAILASDTQTNLKDVEAIVASMQAGDIDILIGTQIVAKGYHFPGLTVVGVVDGDLGLGGGDLRAAERSFQLLYQVAGRSGREDEKGHVYIQTTQPQHPVMQSLQKHDRNRLLETLITERETFRMPPFARLATLTLSGAVEETVEKAADDLARILPTQNGVQVLGPAPAPMALLRGKHRRRFLIKTRREDKIQAFLHGWLAKADLPGTVRLHIDIDPQTFV